MRTRLTTRVSRLWPSPPTSPPTATARTPVRKTRRGPKTSAALPAVGCATALARYNAVTSAAVCPTGTPTPWAIGTSAVAISELLTGLSAEPRNSGVVNRHVKARPGAMLPWRWGTQRLWWSDGDVTRLVAHQD